MAAVIQRTVRAVCAGLGIDRLAYANREGVAPGARDWWDDGEAHAWLADRR